MSGSNPEGLKIARERIAAEKIARTGTLDLGVLGLTELPDELFELDHLERLNLGSGYYDEKGNWKRAQSDLGINQFDVDLERLQTLPSLIQLHLRSVNISDLAPIAGLTQLQTLHCSGTQVSKLDPIAGLTQLQSLNCSDTQVSDLDPIAGLTQLTTLDCSRTQVSKLDPIAGLTQLQTLYCWGTQVNKLDPIAGLTQLKTLFCSHTKVSNLEPIAGLTLLKTLNCGGTQIQTIPEWLVNLPNINDLKISGPNISNIPNELLSKAYGDNCLDRLRAHFKDLAKGSDPLTDVKLLIIGNGQIGKTQICRRLRDEEFDKSVRSTHGIEVHTIDLPMRQASMEGIETARLHLWDFGGQDLYHGTHRLFLKSRSVFMIGWTPKSEDNKTHTVDGMTFRNHRLPYWVESVRLNAGNQQPLILVQNQCDKPEDEEPVPPVARDILKKFKNGSKPVHYSAMVHDSDQFAMLLRELRNAVQNQWKEHGVPKIGKGRMRVKNKIEELQKANKNVRQRTMTLAEFDALCQFEGDVYSSAMLLEYLDAAGVVIYRPDLFEDRIILDHGWAFQAIYAVMDRERTYREILRDGGVFVQSELAKTVWAQYPEADQELFLKLMQSCGICFIYREAEILPGRETEYLAPDLLPGREAVADELDRDWNHFDEPTQRFEVILPFLHPGLMRGLICRVGREAKAIPTYWKDGICFYDTLTRSHGLIEQIQDEIGDRWSGRLIVSTRRGDAKLLLGRLHDWLIEILEQEIGPQKSNNGHVNWEIKADQKIQTRIGGRGDEIQEFEPRKRDWEKEPMTDQERQQLIEDLSSMTEDDLRFFINKYHHDHVPAEGHSVHVITRKFTQWAGSKNILNKVRQNLDIYCSKNISRASQADEHAKVKPGVPFVAGRNESVDKDVDIAILTVTQEEFNAVLNQFKQEPESGFVNNKSYIFRSLNTSNGLKYRIAILKCPDQGNEIALKTAMNVIADLKPRQMLLVGIAGARPVDEFSIGDVVISQFIYDFTKSTFNANGKIDQDPAASYLHTQSQNSVALIPARLTEMAGWNSEKNIGMARPNMEFDENQIPPEVDDYHWVKKIKSSLQAAAKPSEPIVRIDCKFASSNILMKDPKYLQKLTEIARKVEVVEMEAAGVMIATHDKSVPFFSIRGISDIVGYKRKGNLNDYAAKIAAAFTKAYLETGPFEQKQA